MRKVMIFVVDVIVMFISAIRKDRFMRSIGSTRVFVLSYEFMMINMLLMLMLSNKNGRIFINGEKKRL